MQPQSSPGGWDRDGQDEQTGPMGTQRGEGQYIGLPEVIHPNTTGQHPLPRHIQGNSFPAMHSPNGAMVSRDQCPPRRYRGNFQFAATCCASFPSCSPGVQEAPVPQGSKPGSSKCSSQGALSSPWSICCIPCHLRPWSSAASCSREFPHPFHGFALTRPRCFHSKAGREHAEERAPG